MHHRLADPSRSVPASIGPCLSRRRVLRLGAAAWGALALPALRADEPPSFSVQDLDWTDTERDRPVPVRLYLPERSGPVPLMVFSHGLGGSRLGYSYLGRHVAAQGVASLHVQHSGSDRSIWSGNPLTLVGRLHQAARDVEALARVKDLHFALDRLLADGRWGERLDRQRIVAAGHSYGANTAMLAAGARVRRDGLAPPQVDGRLKGLLLLSSPPFYGEADLGAVLAPVQLPSLHITTTEDVIEIPGYQSPASDRVAVYQAMGSRRKALAVFEGGSHSIFTDRTGPGGPVLNSQVKAATQSLVTAFLNDLFHAQPNMPADRSVAQWRLAHAGLLARFELSAAAA